MRLLKSTRPGAISVYLRGGVYRLRDTLVFTAEGSGEPEAPIRYTAYPGEQVTLSGGTAHALTWKPFRNGIMQAQVRRHRLRSALRQRPAQMLARPPNHDPNAKYLNGFAPDSISAERAEGWANPAGVYIHALHQYLWGDMHFVITSKDPAGNLTYEGGCRQPRDAHALAI